MRSGWGFLCRHAPRAPLPRDRGSGRPAGGDAQSEGTCVRAEGIRAGGGARGGLIAALPSGRAPAPLPALAAGSSGLEAPRKGSTTARSDASRTLCPPRVVPWGFAAVRRSTADGARRLRWQPGKVNPGALVGTGGFPDALLVARSLGARAGREPSGGARRSGCCCSVPPAPCCRLAPVRAATAWLRVGRALNSAELQSPAVPSRRLGLHGAPGRAAFKHLQGRDTYRYSGQPCTDLQCQV